MLFNTKKTFGINKNIVIFVVLNNYYVTKSVMKKTFIIFALLLVSLTSFAKKEVHTRSGKNLKNEKSRLEKNSSGAYIWSVEWQPITEKTCYFILKRSKKHGLIKTEKDFKTKNVKRIGKKYYKSFIYVS